MLNLKLSNLRLEGMLRLRFEYRILLIPDAEDAKVTQRTQKKTKMNAKIKHN